MLLTAVINVHREGLWAHKAIRSAVAALSKLPEGKAEIVIVADRANAETIDVCFRACGATTIPSQIVHVDVGDLGRARNHGVLAAAGKYVAFLDGDDVWGEDWARLGVEALERETAHKGYTDAVVAHPFLNIDFGDNSFWWTQPDQRDTRSIEEGGFDPATFWTTNCWSSGAMAPRALLLDQPYRARTAGLGFEDWEWNARTMAAGVLHVSVPRAVVFIRKKADGLNVDSANKRQIPAHSAYFESPPAAWPRHSGAFGEAERAALVVDEEWLVPQWRAAHQIEPALWPDARLVRALPRYRAWPVANVPAIAKAVSEKVDATWPESKGPTHVILGPCLVKGGADRRIVEYAKAVARAGDRPLILLTDRDDDPSWATNIPDNVRAINVHDLLNKAGQDSAVLALTRLLMRWGSSPDGCVVHIVNSQRGYSAVTSYGAALKDSGCKIFCSLYGSEPHANGRLGGASFNGWFFAMHKHVDAVLSDNRAHLKQLEEIHGWPLSRSFVAPTPTLALSPSDAAVMSAAREQGRKKLGGALRVLWASRMVRGKRPDRLLAVAKLAHERKLPIFFAVAGEPADQWADDVAKELRALPNVKLSAKAFDGWATLAPDKHDVFMFTSEAEGMPNVVLEALSFGLPVVSTDVGDVAQTPANVTGNPDAPAVWIDRLQTWRTSGVDYVRNEHSTAKFDAALRVAGYLK